MAIITSLAIGNTNGQSNAEKDKNRNSAHHHAAILTELQFSPEKAANLN